MNRMWEIREGDESQESKYGRRKGSSMYGRKDDAVEEAYDCGFEDGFRAAMKEYKHSYGERMGR